MSQIFRNSSDDSLTRVSPQLGCRFQPSSENLLVTERPASKMAHSHAGKWIWLLIGGLSPCSVALSMLLLEWTHSMVFSFPRIKWSKGKECRCLEILSPSLKSHILSPRPCQLQRSVLFRVGRVRVMQAILVIWYCGISSPFVQIAPDS